MIKLDFITKKNAIWWILIIISVIALGYYIYKSFYSSENLKEGIDGEDEEVDEEEYDEEVDEEYDVGEEDVGEVDEEYDVGEEDVGEVDEEYEVDE
jgi:hypothetical protein